MIAWLLAMNGEDFWGKRAGGHAIRDSRIACMFRSQLSVIDESPSRN